MSKATPLGSHLRLLNYLKQNAGGDLKPGQYRRWQHKSHGAVRPESVGSSEGSKGRPTPRQRKQRRDA